MKAGGVAGSSRWRISSAGLLSVVALAVTVGAFLWSHPPTAYRFMMAFGLFLVLFVWKHQSWKRLPYVACAITLGLGLSAAYVYPAYVEQDLIRREFVSNTWPYHSTYVFSSSVPYNVIDFSWIFNTVAILLGAVVLLALERQFVERTPGLRRRVLLWVIVGCVATFMMTSLSYPLGRLIPKIDIGVFAWRMLAITTLVAALLAGACTQAALSAVRTNRTSQVEFVFLSGLSDNRRGRAVHGLDPLAADLSDTSLLKCRRARQRGDDARYRASGTPGLAEGRASRACPMAGDASKSSAGTLNIACSELNWVPRTSC